MSGPEAAEAQLRTLGYEVMRDGEWVEFDYEVPGGTYAGTKIRQAWHVPGNFPITPPSGIDFKPRMPGRTVNSGEHPARSSHSRRFGGDGEYWSRPHHGWNSEPVKDARAYLVWVQTLWVTT